MNSKPIWQMSAADTAAKLRAKELSAVDAVGAAIEFQKFVRSEISFESIQYLTEQIKSDIKLVREFFFNESHHFLTED